MAEEQSYIGKYLMGYSLTLGPLLEFKGMGQTRQILRTSQKQHLMFIRENVAISFSHILTLSKCSYLHRVCNSDITPERRPQQHWLLGQEDRRVGSLRRSIGPHLYSGLLWNSGTHAAQSLGLQTVKNQVFVGHFQQNIHF